MLVCQSLTAFIAVDAAPNASPSVNPVAVRNWRAPVMFLTPLREKQGFVGDLLVNRMPGNPGASFSKTRPAGQTRHRWVGIPRPGQFGTHETGRCPSVLATGGSAASACRGSGYAKPLSLALPDSARCRDTRDDAAHRSPRTGTGR